MAMTINARRVGFSLRPDQILATADLCTKCGICQAHCPVVAVTDKFPGPKYAGPQAQRFRDSGAELDHSFDLCTGCGICASVCPNDVEIVDIINIARSRRAGSAGAIGLGRMIVSRPEMLGRLLGRAPALANAILRNRSLRKAAEFLLGISAKAPLPEIHGREFHSVLRSSLPADESTTAELVDFPGCSVEHFDPETGIAVMRLLRVLGFSPLALEGCCSLPMLSSGEWSKARSNALKLVSRIADSTSNTGMILTSSTSCGLALKSKYGTYLSLSDERSKKVASAVRDVCEFIRDTAMDRLRAELRPYRKRVLYHAPCQLLGHGIGLPALELLRSVPELEIVVSESSCCGIGGTYGYAADRHEISAAIARPLHDQIIEASPDWIVCDSETCRWHLEALTKRPAVHPAQILLDALS